MHRQKLKYNFYFCNTFAAVDVVGPIANADGGIENSAWTAILHNGATVVALNKLRAVLRMCKVATLTTVASGFLKNYIKKILLILVDVDYNHNTERTIVIRFSGSRDVARIGDRADSQVARASRYRPRYRISENRLFHRHNI